MTSNQEADYLVERYHAGTSYSVSEFITLLNILLPYAEEGSAFEIAARQQIDWALNLDQNEVIISMQEVDDTLYPVAITGVGLGIVS